MPIEINPKRTGVKAVLHVFTDEEWLNCYAELGFVEFKVDPKNGPYMLHTCPGCGRFGGISIGATKPAISPSWSYTGDLTKVETVSLQPSIFCKGCCGWHGYLKNGIFVSV